MRSAGTGPPAVRGRGAVDASGAAEGGGTVDDDGPGELVPVVPAEANGSAGSAFGSSGARGDAVRQGRLGRGPDADAEGGDDEARGTRQRQRPSDAAADESPAADRVLDPALADRGDRDRDAGQGESGDEWQLAVDRRGRQDEHRPVPEVQRVGDPAELAHRRQRQEPGRERGRAGAHRRRSRAPRRSGRAGARQRSGNGVDVGRRSDAGQGRRAADPTATRPRANATAGGRASAIDPEAPGGRRAPSSHARAGSVKNAQGWADARQDKRQDERDDREHDATTASPAGPTRRRRRTRRRASSSAGQNR